MPNITVRRRMLLSGSRFRPSRLGGLILWLASDRITGVADGGALSTVLDFSGQGNNGTATASPILVYGAQAGKAAMRFAAASTQYITVDGIADDLAGSDIPFTVICAAKCTNTGANRTMFSLGNTGTNTQFHNWRVSNGAAFYQERVDDAATSKGNGVGSVSTVPHVFSTVFTGTRGSTWLDSVAFESSLDMDVGTCTFNRATVCAFGRAGIGGPWEGDFYEIVIYNRALSTGERLLVERYMGRRWAIPVLA